MKNTTFFNFTSTNFDENYLPSESSRVTTNFANLARGERRQQNLRHTLQMINNRFNELAHWDNQTGDRYSVELEIVSVELVLNSNSQSEPFPLIELLKLYFFDKKNNQRIDGIVGNNFSSYLRDYDFNVLLPEYNTRRLESGTPENFGVLHGELFKQFINSSTYSTRFHKAPVICISVSTSKTYAQTGNQHPILGVEYKQSELSLTDQYFEKMGLQVRFFMPFNSAAPLAFYFKGDLLGDYTNLELIGTISTMETFQRIYRPEIYNTNSAAGRVFRPSLNNTDFSLTQVVYDRVERNQLAINQGKFAEEHFLKPFKHDLDQLIADTML